MTKLDEKVINRNNEILKHLEFDVKEAKELFNTHQINGCMLVVSYADGTQNRVLFGLEGDAKLVFNATVAGVQNVLDRLPDSKTTKH